MIYNGNAVMYHKKGPDSIVEKDCRCNHQHRETDKFVKLRTELVKFGSSNVGIKGWRLLTYHCCKRSGKERDKPNVKLEDLT